MSGVKKTIKKIIPTQSFNKLRPIYHGIKARYNSRKFNYPAKKLKIIGVTGTKGKTTTTTLMGRLMNLIGIKTGYITTALINLDGHSEYLNPHKMTTLDSHHIQKYLSQMVKNNCEYAILELSSQGLHQNRHIGIGKLESGLFLNIFPEHIEYHGTFDNYLTAKAEMFKILKTNGKAIINNDSEHSSKFIKKIPNYAQIIEPTPSKEIKISTESDFTKGFYYKDKKYKTHFYTDYDVENSYLAAVTIAKTVAKNKTDESKLLSRLLSEIPKLSPVSGRMEWVVKNGKTLYKKSNPQTPKRKISIIVDYAHEPESMKQLLKTLSKWKPNLYQNIIHIVSCDGAGRDDWKKPILGEISYKLADYSILTTDNYDENDNPKEIVSMLEAGLPKKQSGKKYFKLINRRKAFQKALNLAMDLKGKTIVVSTGVGTEQGLTQPNKTMNWDEREVWHKEYLKATKPKLLK